MEIQGQSAMELASLNETVARLTQDTKVSPMVLLSSSPARPSRALPSAWLNRLLKPERSSKLLNTVLMSRGAIGGIALTDGLADERRWSSLDGRRGLAQLLDRRIALESDGGRGPASEFGGGEVDVSEVARGKNDLGEVGDGGKYDGLEKEGVTGLSPVPEDMT